MTTPATELPAAAAAPEPPPTPPAPEPALPDEVDVLWGGYAGRTLLPAFLGTLLATVLLAWLLWAVLPARFFKVTLLASAGSLWLLAVVRWTYRFFGYNFRMTNRRLFRARGFLSAPNESVELAAVTRVLVKKNGWDRLVGVGRVLVYPEDPQRPTLVLEGVKHPMRIAEEIRVQAQKAREAAAAVARVVA